MTTKKLTAYNEANEREIESMVGKAMCAYANWQGELKALYAAKSDTARTLAKQGAIAYKNEYEATVRCIDMFVRENVYEIQHIVKGRAEVEFGIEAA